MPRNRLALPACLIATLATWGCCAHKYHAPCAPPEPPSDYELPFVERGRIFAEVPLDRIAAAEQVPPAPIYRGLSAMECQCLAADASVIGDLIDRERATARPKKDTDEERRAYCLRLALLDNAARHFRNKDAADALRLYYGLMEVEAGLDAVDDGMPIVVDALAKIADMRRQGLTVSFDATLWDRQRQSLEAKRFELTATRGKLNSQLRGLLGLADDCDPALFFPTELLELTDLHLDEETEVACATASNPELNLWRLLATSDPELSGAAISGLLNDMHGLMGVAARAGIASMWESLWGLRNGEECLRRAQAAEMTARREAQLRSDVRAAVRAVEFRRRQSVETQRQVASWQARQHELAELKETGGSTFLEQAEAELQEIEIRNNVTKSVLEWRRAQVELAALQGRLVDECRCGLPPTSMFVLPPPPVPELVPTRADPFGLDELSYGDEVAEAELEAMLDELPSPGDVSGPDLPSAEPRPAFQSRPSGAKLKFNP